LRQQEDDPGDPIQRILPRALMVPPGRPEFLTRERIVEAGPCALEGRAWSGFGEISSVHLSVDGGETWDEAVVGPGEGRWAWRRWTFEWHAEPGTYELCCRAQDSAGNEQPGKPEWNLGGYVNNAVQRVPVTVV
jgi:sulfane dehydrogenase subunit SoxC